MSTTFFEWLQTTPPAIAVGENWFPYVESAHVVFLAVVAGTIFIVDTRLMGLTSRHLRFSYLAERVLPWTWLAFIGAVITGLLMFIANATSYIDNTPFLIKMGLLVLAGVNMGYFQLFTYRSVAAWDAAGRPPARARAAGLFSILLWTAIVGFGRWIGFV